MGTIRIPQYVGLDTNLFIYYFQETSPFHDAADALFTSLASQHTRMAGSILSLTELLSVPASEKDLQTMESFLFSIPRLTLYEVDKNIARETARLRRQYAYRLADAVLLATCLLSKADTFITNDRKLKSFPELPVLLLSELH